jgi:hypothetical protein
MLIAKNKKLRRKNMNKDKIPDEYKMPNSLVRAKRIPSLPMDALKLNVLMHAYSQQGQSSCPIEHVIHFMPNMAKKNERDEMLRLLNKHVVVPQKARVTVKPYDFIRYENGRLHWSYTMQYLSFFRIAGIKMFPNMD